MEPGAVASWWGWTPEGSSAADRALVAASIVRMEQASPAAVGVWRLKRKMIRQVANRVRNTLLGSGYWKDVLDPDLVAAVQEEPGFSVEAEWRDYWPFPGQPFPVQFTAWMRTGAEAGGYQGREVERLWSWGCGKRSVPRGFYVPYLYAPKNGTWAIGPVESAWLERDFGSIEQILTEVFHPSVPVEEGSMDR